MSTSLPFAVTAVTAALIAFLYCWLAFRVIGYRQTQQINFGDGGDKEMLRRMRAHSNCGEYAPFSLLLLLLVELSGAPQIASIILAILLIGGRVLHAYSFVKKPMNFLARQAGMAMTFTMIGLASIGLLLHVVI